MKRQVCRGRSTRPPVRRENKWDRSRRRPPIRPPAPFVRKMLLGASVTAVLQATSSASGFVVAVALARLLGSQGYGIYVFAFGMGFRADDPCRPRAQQVRDPGDRAL